MGNTQPFQVDLDDAELFELILAEFVTSMRCRGLSERTISERCYVLAKMSEQTGMSPLDVRVGRVEEWLARRPSLSTRQTYHSHLMVWGTYLVRRGWRPDNPMLLIDSPRVKRREVKAVSRRQLQAVLASNLRLVTRQRILIAAYSGLRVSEIARIRGEDFDWVENTLRVIGKGGREDVIPVHPVIVEIARTMPRKGYWFPSASASGHVEGKTISRGIKEAFARCGVSMTCHQLRHFFATELVAAGAQSAVVQVLMRHTSLATTSIYIHINHAQQREALALLAPTH